MHNQSIIFAKKKILICPKCEKNNDLTWKKYWVSPFGNHVCEYCQAKFHLERTFKYYMALIFFIIVIGLLPFFIARKSGASFELAFAIFCVFNLGIMFPLDKKIDNSWRKTISKNK